MAKNKLSDLRDHLFETIEKLKDKDDPMDINRAKAIANTAQAIINSAKIELQAIDVLGLEMENTFFGIKKELAILPALQSKAKP